MAHDLISITRMPSMPGPFSSDGPGECWVWGDFVLFFQRNPRTVLSIMQQSMGNKAPQESHLTYPFAMTVFYRQHRNPHGPSHRPIYVATIEKVDYRMAAQNLPELMGELANMAEHFSGQPVLGMFTATGHLNFGDYTKSEDPDTVRDVFFEMLSESLDVSGQPARIGEIRDVYGHPETGWPQEEPEKPQIRAGLKIASLLGVAILLVLALILLF